MKNLICRLLGLVRREEMEEACIRRERFILSMTKHLDPTKCKALYSGEVLQNETFDGTLYVVGDYVSVVGCRIKGAEIAPFVKHFFGDRITTIGRGDSGSAL